MSGPETIKNHKSGKYEAPLPEERKAQATLELTLSLIIIVILLGGMVKVLVWGTRSIVGRHNKYVSDFTNTFDDDPSSNDYIPSKVELVPKVKGVAP